MKKFVSIVMVILLTLMITSTAYATTNIPAGKITLTATVVDYVSALAGIAKPVETTHYENERVAILVTVDVPQWYDTSNMSVVMEPVGMTIDSSGLAIATGNYLLFGTLYSTTGKLTITIRDNAVANASSAQAFWSAFYGDRTVSTVVTFSIPTAAIGGTTLYTTPVVEIPQTGDASVMGYALILLAVSVVLMVIMSKHNKFVLRR